MPTTTIRPIDRRVPRDHWNTNGSLPPLTRAQELDLFRRLRAGDESARETLIRSNLRFVIRIAHQYVHKTTASLEEVVSDGREGLLEAVNRFDPERGIKFISYAVWWIKQAILKGIPEAGRCYRIPLSAIGDSLKYSKARHLDEQANHRHDPPEVIAGMGISDHRAMNIWVINQAQVSLDAAMFHESRTRHGEGSVYADAVLVDDPETRPDAAADRAILAERMAAAMRCLTYQEKRIIAAYFGMVDGAPLGPKHRQVKARNYQGCMSLDEIGLTEGLTRERIRQIKARALDKLRRQPELAPFAAAMEA